MSNLPRLRQQIHDLFAQIFHGDVLFAPHASLAFETKDKLGEGGMGVVYRVFDKRLERHAALKILQSSQANIDGVRRFLREARITAQLRHPAIPSVYEAGTTVTGDTYMLMQVVEGRTLEDKLELYHDQGRSARRLSELLDILIKVAQAVAFAHSQGIIHRDLKPANIMVGRFGEVMVMDWGLARGPGQEEMSSLFDKTVITEAELAEEGLTLHGAVLGTPGYMPPEQAGGEVVDKRCDIYALGAILTEMLTAQKPVGGQTSLERITKTLKEEISSPRELDPSTSAELNSLAKWALAPSVDDRLDDAEVFADELTAYLRSEELRSHSYGPWSRLKRFAEKHPTGLLLSLTLALVLGVSTVVLVQLRAHSRHADLVAAQSKQEMERVKKAEEQSRAIFEGFENCRELAATVSDPGRVREALEAALKLSGRTEHFLIVSGRILRSCSDFKGARQYLEEAIRLYPPCYDGLFDLHICEKLESPVDYELGTGAYKRLVEVARERGDENVFTKLQQCQEFVVSGEYKKAESLLDGLQRESRIFVGVVNIKANLAMRRKDWDQALTYIEQVARLLPNSLAVRLNRGFVYSQMGELSKAEEEFRSVMLVRPDWHVVHSNMGNLFLKAGNHELAALYYDKSNKCKPTGMSYNGLGLALRRQSQYREAIGAFNKAIELEPSVAIHYFERGFCYYLKDDFKLAIDDFDRSLEHDKDYGPAYFQRGVCYEQLKQMAKAEADYKKAESVGMDQRAMGQVYARRGVLRARRRQHEKALEDYQRALNYGYDGPDFFFNMGLAYGRLKLREKELEAYTRALEKMPRFFQALANRANCYRDLGQYKKAEADVNEVLKLFPKQYLMYVIRGQIRTKMGRRREALQDYQVFLIKDPENPNAPKVRRLIAKLRGDG